MQIRRGAECDNTLLRLLLVVDRFLQTTLSLVTFNPTSLGFLQKKKKIQQLQKMTK